MVTKKIKVYVDYGKGTEESMWAYEISPGKAKLANIPFVCHELSLGDLVKIAKDGRILRVLEHTAQTFGGKYSAEGSKEEVYERFATIWEHLRKHDILVEPAFPGVLSMSVPRDISIPQVREICAECGVVLFDDLLAEMKDEVLEN